MGLGGLFLEVSARVAFPVDGGEVRVGLGRVVLDGHEPVGAVCLGDGACGVSVHVERVDGDDAAVDGDLLEQHLHGGDFAALVVEGTVCERRAGCVVDHRRGLVVVFAVAVGTADAFSVDRDRTAEVQSRHCEALQRRLDLFGIDGDDDPVQGRLRDRHIKTGLRVLPGADRFQLARILGSGDRAAHVRKPGEDVDRERGCDAVLAALAAPEVLDPVEFLVERAKLARRPADMALGFPCRGQVSRRAQTPAGVAPQGIDIETLGLPVGIGVAATMTREAPFVAEIVPVGGFVDRALEVRRIDKRLGVKHLMAGAGLLVVTETAHHRSERKRSETRKDTLHAEDEETGIVRDQMQAPELRLRRPPDPAVAVPALEGAGLPPGKGNPQTTPCDDVAQAASGEALEVEVGNGASQPVHPTEHTRANVPGRPLHRQGKSFWAPR